MTSNLLPCFNFAQYIISTNSTRPNKIAIVDDLGTVTYGKLSNLICSFAEGLHQLGLKQEDRVLLLMHDSSDWVVAFLGCLYAGVIPVVANTLLTTIDYEFIIKDSRVKSVLVSSALLPTLEKSLEQIDHKVQHILVSRHPDNLTQNTYHFSDFLKFENTRFIPASTLGDEPAFWLYSSGSTGQPKGTIHTQRNLYYSVELFGKTVLKLKEDDVVFSTAKLFFAYGLGNSLTQTLSAGASSVLTANRPTPEVIFEQLIKHQVTIFFSAPTGYIGMLANDNIPDKNKIKLRLCFSGGEALPYSIAKRWSEYADCEIIDCIGSTEMLTMFISNRPGDVRYGTTGKPVSGYEVQLRGEQGEVITDHNKIGDLYIKGPTAALMYWNNREKTRDTFQGEWTKSGDKYMRDSEGYYIYIGRNDDMLKVSGIYVSPFEVESTLVQHPAILEAAVVGTIDADGLTKTKAFVVLKSGQSLTEEEVKVFVKSQLAPYKYPRLVEFVDNLPKTSTGKLQRFRLRNMNKNEQQS
jgi:benzoate-CoA ligase